MGATLARKRETAEERAPQRRAFAEALFHIMDLKGVSHRELGEQVGLTHTAFTGWRNLDHESSPAIIFAVERALDLPPGFLSIHLGYLPPEARSLPSPEQSYEAVVDSDPALDDRARRMLKVMYSELRKPQPRKRQAR
jgi:transcriptional regulator with XRE-family HTH domain